MTVLLLHSSVLSLYLSWFQIKIQYTLSSKSAGYLICRDNMSFRVLTIFSIPKISLNLLAAFNEYFDNHRISKLADYIRGQPTFPASNLLPPSLLILR